MGRRTNGLGKWNRRALSFSLSLSLSPQLRGGGQVVVRRTRLHAETSRQIYTQLKNEDAEGSENGTPLEK